MIFTFIFVRIVDALVYSGDLSLEFPIATKCRSFKLTFALDQGLDVDEYLKIYFPFALHSSGGTQDVYGILYKQFYSNSIKSGGWDPTQVPRTGSVITQTLGKNYTTTTQNNIYMFNFNIALNPLTWYVIEIQTNQTSVQTPGFKSPIQFQTVSSTLSGAIVYDQNPSFASISLGSLPAQTLKFSVNYTQFAPGQQQNITLNITPTITIGVPQQFLVELVSTDYQFQKIDTNNNFCVLAGCICSSPYPNMILIRCQQDLVATNQSITVNLLMLNAKILFTQTTTSDLAVYSIYQNAFIEYNIQSNQFSLTKILMTSQVNVLWGVKVDNDLATLFQPISAAVGAIYNSITVTFNLTSSLPSLEQLVIITTGTANSIPENTIAQNLGSYVTCYFNPTQTAIYCKNVTNLQSNTSYFVSFKCAFAYSASSTQNNFGFVSIRSVVRSTTGYTSYLLAGPIGNSINVKYSQEYTDPAFQGQANFGMNYVSSVSASTAIAAAIVPGNGITIGLITGPQKIVFYMKVPATLMCPSTDSINCNAGKQPEIYIQILFNKNQIALTAAPFFEFSKSCAGKCTITSGTYSSDSYILIWCQKDYNTCSTLLNGGQAFAMFGTISSQDTMYPSNLTLDFVVSFKYGPSGTSLQNSQFVSAQLVQGYVMSIQPRTMQASYINYYSFGATVNSGTIIPAILRLTGSIQQPGQSLGVFLDQSVDYFFTSTLSNPQVAEDNSVAYTATKIIGSRDSVWYPNRGTLAPYSDNYLNQRMLLIPNLTGASAEDNYFGFRNTANLPQSIVVASLNFNNNTNAYDIVQAMRIFGAAYQIPNFATTKSYYAANGIIAAQGLLSGATWNSFKAASNVVPNYKVFDTTVLLTGASITLKIQADHTDSGNLIQQNAGSLWGSGFTIVGVTNAQTITWTGGTCKYFSSIIFCPWDLVAFNDASAGNLVQIQYNVPATYGDSDSLPFTYGWSTSAGNLAAYKQETQTMPAAAARQLCKISNWDPIYPATKRQPISFNVTFSIDYPLELNQVLSVQLIASQLPGGFTVVDLCFMIGLEQNLTCSITGSGNQIIFGFQANVEFTLLSNTSQTILFYASHSGSDTDQQTLSANIIATNIVDTCSNQGQITFQSSSLSSLINIDSYSLQNINQFTKTQLSIGFSLNNRTLLPETRFLITLGFLQSANSIIFSSGNAQCFFQQNGQLSRAFQYLNYVPQTQSLQFQVKDTCLSQQAKYTLICSGLRNPDGTSTTLVTVAWTDIVSSDSVIQSNTISYSQISLQQQLPFQNQVNLTKYLNCPGFGAYYQFSIQPSRTNLTHHGRIYIEFSSSVYIGQDLSCYLNSIQVDCYNHTIPQRIVIVPWTASNNRMKPNQIYTLLVGPIKQPRIIDSFGRIWIAMDLNTNEQDGYQEFSYLAEIPVQSNLPSVFPFSSLTLTSFTTRTSKVYLQINFTAPIRSINTANILTIQLSESFAKPLKRQGNSIECRLYRIGDLSLTNVSTACSFRFDRFIVIQLRYDQNNARSTVNYQLEIRSLITPDFRSSSMNFTEEFYIFFTDQYFQTVSFVSTPQIQVKPSPLSFLSSSQGQFNWYIYDQDLDQYTLLQPIVGFSKYPTYTVYQGVLKRKQLFLGLESPSIKFQRQVQLSVNTNLFYIYGRNTRLTNYPLYASAGLQYPQIVDPNPNNDPNISLYSFEKLTNYTQNMMIEVGDIGYWFDIFAQDTVGSGLFYVNFSAIVSDKRTTFKEYVTFATPAQSIYSSIPILAIEVQSEITCPITFSGSSNIPINGKSQPIRLITDCTPQSLLTVVANVQSPITVSNSVVLGINVNQLFQVGNPKQNQNNYFIFSCADGSAGGQITVSFTILGKNADKFTIGTLKLFLVANDVITPNNITVTNLTNGQYSVICDKDGLLYYSVSFADQNIWQTNSLLASTTTINANFLYNQIFYYINPLSQFLQNYKQYGAPSPKSELEGYQRSLIYGYVGEKRISRQVLINKLSPITITADNIEQNTQIQMYCKDNYDQITSTYTDNLSSANKTILSTHILLTFSFLRAITSNQINNLICSVQQYLIINRYQATDYQCQQCNVNILNYTKKTWTDVLANNETAVQILQTNYTESSRQLQIKINSYSKIYVYLNNYPSSSGAQEDMYANLLAFLSTENITLELNIYQLGKAFVNTTVDPEISYLYRYLTLQNITEGTYKDAQGVIKLNTTVTSKSIQVSLGDFSDQLVFVSLSSDSLYLSNPFLLRQGVAGDGIKLEQFWITSSEKNYTFNVIENQTVYYLQWSSAPIKAHLLGGVVLDNNSTKREWISGLYSKNNDINIHMKNENCKCRDVKHKNKNECADWSKQNLFKNCLYSNRQPNEHFSTINREDQISSYCEQIRQEEKIKQIRQIKPCIICDIKPIDPKDKMVYCNNNPNHGFHEQCFIKHFRSNMTLFKQQRQIICICQSPINSRYLKYLKEQFPFEVEYMRSLELKNLFEKYQKFMKQCSNPACDYIYLCDTCTQPKNCPECNYSN